MSVTTEIAPRITIDPTVRGGKPVVRGSRVSVEDILELVASGLSFERIVKECFPHLTQDDVQACVRYAAQVVKTEDVHVLGDLS